MNARGAVMVIGNFDGVHSGHRAVIAAAHAHAHADGPARQLRLVAFTFDPHPALVLTGRAVPQLCSLKRRIELLEQAGADEVVVTSFSTVFAQTSPEGFAQTLADRGASFVYVGENFRFGKDRAGNVALLSKLGSELGFEVRATRLFGASDAPVSSSQIRAALNDSDVARAALMLGRPHRIRGVVAHGDAKGRELGFPTANIAEYTEMLPAHGVYAARATVAGRTWDAVLNIGVRPTVGGRELRVEAHLLDASLDLYGQEMALDLLKHLRAEQRFDSLDELKGQIARDVEQARAMTRSGT